MTISKDKFIEVIEFIKNKLELENNFCTALEAMSPFTYVDAFIYEEYQNLVINLLKLNLNIPEDDDTIEFWMWDLEFGKKYYDGCFIGNGVNVDISTPENLYEYLFNTFNIGN